MSEWSLIVGRAPGLLTWVLLVACVGLALVEAGLPLVRRSGQSKSERRGAPAILGLRVLAIAALIAMVLELGVRVETFTGASRRVVVLVDHSASMDLADGPADADPGRETTRRFDRTRASWREGASARERWREGGVDVEVRGFASEVTPLTRTSADELALEPDGAASDLTRALVELDESDAGEGAPLAAVVVISDGLVSADPATARHLGTVVD
ncbi:MAG TPA: hypothetical protein VM869_32965, partial [Enhygromyxa sp.]|nr:hypothetical protein [Enhygromyxa sp.]